MAAIAAAVFALPVFGQEAAVSADEIRPENRSEYYYVNVSLERVVPHTLGYIVTYRKGNFGLAESYLPIKWFSGTAGKAELIRLGGTADWPYLSVFFKGGKVDHVRLYVRREFAHQSWGVLPPGKNVDERFNVEDLILER